MEEFGDFSTNDFEFEDPAADFLAREKEMLGDDVDFIAGTSEMPSTSNIDLDNYTSPQNVPLPFGDSDFSESNIFSNSSKTEDKFQSQGNNNQNELFSPSNSFSINNDNVSNNFTGVTSPDRYSSLSQAPSSSYQNLEIESDFVKNWKVQFQDRLGDKDRREIEKHQNIKEEAQRSLDKFYREYQSKKESKINEIGRVYSNDQDVNQGKSEWDLVSTILTSGNNINTKNNANVKDINRLKDLIHDLNSSGHVPKVSS
ncbi:hypothetical protein K502DRAFT_331427 [Neoconidiobolus thromboides FSU 785]|nr:hypothetical protein K502DRAFT_331427 [Neoconidiobolus thromboides FSU 785]